MQLFAFGSNGSGQLGLGHTDDVSTPTPCLFSPSSCISQREEEEEEEDRIIRIAAGGNHTLLLTKHGVVYAAGYNEDGRCGENSPDRKEETESLLRFKRILLPHPNPTSNNSGSSLITRFRFVAATWDGSILVTSVRRKATSPTSTCIASAYPDKNAQAKESKPQNQHETDLQFEDKVFVLGTGMKGELGLGANNTHSPSLPDGSSFRDITIPNFPPPGTKITALETGMGHCVAILSNGEVYGWGASRKGQLGESHREAKIVWTPAKILGIPFRASGAACGREFTVVIGDKERGQFVVLGGNKWGVLSDVPTPLLGDASPGFTSVEAGWNGVYVHAAPSPSMSLPGSVNSTTGPGAGFLIAWGRNDRGQLPPPNLPTPVQLAVGSEHALGLLGDGTVVAFGWGEHGNCGPDTDSRGNVAGTWNVISPPDAVRSGNAKVVGIGAGCATSWIIVA